MVREGNEFENLTPEEEEELLQELEETRTIKKTGARLNNKAAAMDAGAQVEKIHTDVCWGRF